MMATSLSTPKLTTTMSSSPALHNLFSKKLPSPLSLPKTLSSLSHLRRTSTSHPHHHLHSRRRFSVSAVDSGNGADSARHYDFDLFTIGAGSGGVRASRFAANFGASVAVCELPFSTISSDTAGGVGGTCVLRGCVPKKLLVYASKFAHEFEESNGFGWRYEIEPKHDWSTLIANKNAELKRLTGIYKNVLSNANVTLIEGRGKIVDPHTVDVDGKLYSARHILVSVGGRPFIPEIPGSEYAIDSDAALDLPTKPEKIAIVGGGYIAVEFAGIFNGLTSDVHVFIRQKKVLRGFDEEVRDFVQEQMALRGIEFHAEESPQAIVKAADGSLSLKTNKGTIEGFSHIMFALLSSMESTARNHLNLLFLLLLLLSFFQRRVATASSPPLFPKEAHPTKSGYLPVNSTSGSAIFYAFYEAQNLTTDISKVPLLFWLQGGPGCSSMLGNFYELGPWLVNFHKHPSDPLALEPNSASWNRIFGVTFLDNPIGSGFSIAANSAEIPRDQGAVAKHLFAAITKFIELDPSFKTRPIYITGESYAGKYIPAIGYYILQKNAGLPAGSKAVNLQGVAIGDGLTDPIIQVNTHAVNAFHSGLINEKQRRELEKLQMVAVGLTAARKWSAATDARNKVLNTLQQMTGLATLYDYTKNAGYKTSLVDELLRNEAVKAALGAKGVAPFERCSNLVGDILHEDVMKSVKYMVEYLLKKTKVLLYQGQYDLRDGVVSSEAWMKTMRWEGIGKFMAADRKVWKVEGEVGGYVQKWGSLSHVMVSGAGHLLPADQPVRAQAMIEDWVLDKGLFANVKE